MKIGVHGASGRLGAEIVAELEASTDFSLVAAIASRRVGDPIPGSAETFCGLEDGLMHVDALIDASDASALDALLDALERTPRPLVSGTTALPARIHQRLDALATSMPILHCHNFSVGVAVLSALAQDLGRALKDLAFDFEIVERHHRDKRDAPSGTALSLRDALLSERTDLSHGEPSRGPRKRSSVPIHAIRGGGEIGTHRLLALGDAERIELRHDALDRRVFAAGAINAARWLSRQPPGRYAMSDVVRSLRSS